MDGTALPDTTGAGTAAGTPVALPEPAIDAVETDRLTRAQTLGTLAYVLSEAKTPDGLWPATLATTAGGGVFDPLSATPDRALVQLPPGSTLRYAASPDGLRMTMRLTGTDPAARDVIYDSAVGTVTNG